MLIPCTRSYPSVPTQLARWQGWEAATGLTTPSLQHAFEGGRSYQPHELGQSWTQNSLVLLAPSVTITSFFHQFQTKKKCLALNEQRSHIEGQRTDLAWDPLKLEQRLEPTC